MTEKISFSVNGEDVDVVVDRDTPLLYVLRNDLGLKGARFGCGQGLCGSCTVIMDGTAIFSCDTPMWSVEGHAVETIEGIGSDGSLHPLQQAFIDEQAGQCAYCLTGIIMRTKALLDKNPTPSRAEIVTDLERNLCRCGSHTRILKAIDKAVGAMSGGNGR